MTHRIVHILPAMIVGGAERALVRLLHGGLASAFDNHVISLGADGPMRRALMEAGAEVHMLDAHGVMRLPLELAALTRRLAPGIVQGWMYHANFAASMVAPFVRPRATLWNIRQSLDDLAGDKFLTRQMIRACAVTSGTARRIIYNSALSARQHEAFGYRADRTVVIANGFETDSVVPDAAAGARHRESLRIPANAPLFVHIARYHPMKDHAGFVAAALRVLAKMPEARFIMVGRWVDDHAAQLLAAVPTRFRRQFSIFGERDDTVAFLQAADALVVSSRRAEGFPNVIGEAMMAATAVIATDTGDCGAIVGDTGLLVPAKDVTALTAAMLRVASDRSLAARLGAAGRARVESCFTISAAAASYRNLYARCLNGEP